MELSVFRNSCSYSGQKAKKARGSFGLQSSCVLGWSGHPLLAEHREKAQGWCCFALSQLRGERTPTPRRAAPPHVPNNSLHLTGARARVRVHSVFLVSHSSWSESGVTLSCFPLNHHSHLCLLPTLTFISLPDCPASSLSSQHPGPPCWTNPNLPPASD